MSDNLGTAIGAAFKTGIGTYVTLQEQAARDLQAKRLQQELDDDTAYRKAQAETPTTEYKGGSAIPEVVDKNLGFYDAEQKGQLKTALGGMTPEQQQSALRSFSSVDPNAKLGDIGVYKDAAGNSMATNEYSAIPESKRQTKVMEKMMQSGNTYGMEKAMRLKTMSRDNELNDKFDKFKESQMENFKLVESTIQSEGLAGIPKAFNGKLKEQGLTSEFKKNATGGVLIVKNKKGEVQGQFTNGQDVANALSQGQLSIFSNEMLPYFKDMSQVVGWLGAQYQLKQGDRKIGLEEQKVAQQGAANAGLQKYRDRMVDLEEKKLSKPSTTKLDVFVNPVDNSQATVVNGRLVDSTTGEPVKNASAYVPLNSANENTDDQKLMKFALEIASAKGVSIEEALAEASTLLGKKPVVGVIGEKDAWGIFNASKNRGVTTPPKGRTALPTDVEISP